MKKALSLLFVVIAWLNPNTTWSQYPQVEFVFGYRPFDLSCEVWTKQPIDQSWYNELRVQLPRLSVRVEQGGARPAWGDGCCAECSI